MGMTIDDCINYLEQTINELAEEGQYCEALELEVETLRKYQQIVEIVSLNDEEFKQCGLRELKEILEVIANGSD